MFFFPLREAVEMGSKYIHDLKRVCVYVAQDCAGEAFSCPFTNTVQLLMTYSIHASALNSSIQLSFQYILSEQLLYNI